MELRRVDPRIIKANPGNPRKIQPGDMSDATLAASIQAVGILQPPAVTEKNGELTLAYGARRVRIAIKLGLPEIDVLVKDPDDHDQMRAVSENVVRAPMATVDLWRSIESLASENWTEEAIASALAIPVRQIRKLRLLATVHPAILDQVGAGDMPKEQELRTIASASREDQACSLEEAEAEKGRGRHLVEDCPGARKDPLLRPRRQVWRGRACGVRHRLAGGPVRGGGRGQSLHRRRRGLHVALSVHGSTPTCPRTASCSTSTNTAARSCRPRRRRTWTKPRKGDQIGFTIHPRDGTVHEVVFRMPEPEAKKGKDRSSRNDEDEASTPKKTRPEITHKGTEIIGALRTEALVKSLEVNAVDDATLIGLLILALNARNVSIQTHGSGPCNPHKTRSVDHRGRSPQPRRRTPARRRAPDARQCPLLLAPPWR